MWKVESLPFAIIVHCILEDEQNRLLKYYVNEISIFSRYDEFPQQAQNDSKNNKTIRY